MLPGAVSGISLLQQSGYLHIFQKLFHFWIVVGFDLFVVQELLILAFVFDELEAMAIEGVFVFFPRNVVNNNFARGGGPLWRDFITS